MKSNALLLAALLPALVAAQTSWPERPVRIVVPYAPGGTTDYAARQIAQTLGLVCQSEFKALIARETKMWSAVAKDAGVKAE
jgi:tripartite-type tricarboxylate transporter receptor subunit TctC